MQVVVLKSPKCLRGLLRRLFGRLDLENRCASEAKCNA